MPTGFHFGNAFYARVPPTPPPLRCNQLAEKCPQISEFRRLTGQNLERQRLMVVKEPGLVCLTSVAGLRVRGQDHESRQCSRVVERETSGDAAKGEDQVRSPQRFQVGNCARPTLAKSARMGHPPQIRRDARAPALRSEVSRGGCPDVAWG